MAKFRFPGKALKLNTRKRVRFRGSYPTIHTPEEIYTKKIRRGLDLFHKLFGDSDEDEDEFDGFKNGVCNETKVPAAKVSEEKKVDEVCSAMEKEGLVRRTRTSAVALAVKEVREGIEKNALVALDERTRVRTSESKEETSAIESVVPVSAMSLPRVVLSRQSRVPLVGHSVHKQTNCRVGRQPTVKATLAKKLLAKAKKKLPSLPVVGEKSPKRFILPTMSARSSRIIKPNKRLFADITEMCSTSSSVDLEANADAAESSSSISLSNKRLVKLSRKSRGAHTRLFRGHSTGSFKGTEGVGKDRMRRTISLYTESITGQSRGRQVGRPPKRLLRRLEAPQQEVEAEVPDSPQKCDPKESRVKEKIEKLLRSAWDDRLKQSGKGGKCDMDEMMPAPASTTSPALSASAFSRTILRKARLNLNKSTLQKIRNPASLQRLIPQSDEGKVEGRCIICDRDEGENTRKFGVIICEVCCSFVSNASDGPKEIFECLESQGLCQVQALEEDNGCLACWLGKILESCFMPNLLHDRLRKRLPPVLKEKIPTSLARCLNLGAGLSIGEKDSELTSHTKRLPLDPGGLGGGAFGTVMDLPGGWRRKTGSEVIVISPSGEKFKSMQKLEEFLKNQGICADARVLFGNSSPVVERTNDSKSHPTTSVKNNERGNVVVTTLPGGWTRRIKWRCGGDRFDTYVNSPDGRTFRSKRELNAYFQQIGKVDDIHKYFPVVNGHSDSSTQSSSDTAGFSSTEPVSSSEMGSDISSDDKSPEASEVEFETPTTGAKKIQARTSKTKGNCSKSKSIGQPDSPKTSKSKVSSPKPEVPEIVRDETPSTKLPDQPTRMKIQEEKGLNRNRSSSSLSDHANESEEMSRSIRGNVNSESKKTERKHKKSKGLRTRSLPVGSKQKESSFTDTTESESEHRQPKEGSMFTKSPVRDRNQTMSSVSEINFQEKKGLCSAWNTILYDSGEDDSESSSSSYTSKVSEERKLPLKSLNRKRKKTGEEKEEFAIPNVVPDAKANCEKVVLKINKKSIVPHEPAKEKTIGGRDEDRLLEREETSGVVSQASAADSPTFKKKPLSVGSHQIDEGTEEESPDPVGESLISALTKAGDSVLRSESKTVINRLTSSFKPKLKKKRKTSRFESVQFGNNWSRKIKWNEKGEGKVALLHSPDGQTIRSRIELLAYFKKAGRIKVDLDYYFPPEIKREKSLISSPGADSLGPGSDENAATLSIVTEGSGHSSDMSDFSDGESFLKTSEDSSASTEEGGRRRRRTITDYSRLGRTLDVSSSLVETTGGRLSHIARTGKRVIVVTGKSGKIPVMKSESEDIAVAVPEPGGPRVKHVCRSQAQVLGIHRAVFPPSPEKDGKPDFDLSSSPPVVVGGGGGRKKKREIVTVTQKASGDKILQKTMWCNKCIGCITPNCRKCVNCIDMKKFGGPGTKKKPCVKRKCLNPRLSAKSVQTAMSQEKRFKKPTTHCTANESFDAKERSRSPAQAEERSLAKPDRVEEKADIVIRVSTQDKSAVFVPRQVTRVQPDQKDRGDIAAGKKFVPGALVNIDYWQGYDVDEMLLSGFSVTTSSPLYPQTLCFRCGSAGQERLTFCIWCCEGVHPFCMEDSEGPESDMEEVFWVCRRCAVCHVCGAPGADSLLRCSDCRNYYHMECLGPSAHSTCQPSPDRPWETEMLIHLSHSWPHQAVLYDADGCEETGLTDAVVIHTELDPLREVDEDDGDCDEPDIYFLPLSDSPEKSLSEELKFGGSSDFDLEDAICLEDSVIEVFRNVDLHKQPPSLTSNLHGQELFTMAIADEYLCLGYKKLIEYASRKVEISYYRLLQIIHNEVFDTLGYPSWKEMLREELVEERPCGTGMNSDSDTDTASEGEDQGDEDSDWDWEDVLEFRRFEALQELQEREGKKFEAERKEKERKREKVRLARQKELEKEGKVKEVAVEPIVKSCIIKRKKKRGRPPGSINKARQGLLDFIVADDGGLDEETSLGGEQETPKRFKFKQPRSWEEFDKLFFRKSEKNDEAQVSKEACGKEKTSWKVIYSVNMKVEKSRLKLKKLEKSKMKMKGKTRLKVLKKLKGVKNLKDKSQTVKLIKGRSQSLKPTKGNVKLKMEKAKKKNATAREIAPFSAKRTVATTQGNEDQPQKKKPKGQGSAALPKKQRAKNGHTKSEQIGKRPAVSSDVSDEDEDDRDDDDDDPLNCSKLDEVVPKAECSKKKRRNITQVEEYSLGKDGSDSDEHHLHVRSEKEMSISKVQGTLKVDLLWNVCLRKEKIPLGVSVDDVKEEVSLSDGKLAKEVAKLNRQQMRSCPTVGASVSNELSKDALENSLKPEEENSDKENRPNVGMSEEVLETDILASAKLINGSCEDNVPMSQMEMDSDCSGNVAESSSISAEIRDVTKSNKKRKLDKSFLNEASPKLECIGKDIVRKVGAGRAELPKNEESPVRGEGLATGRRRRSVGRASLLASQRKAMMD